MSASAIASASVVMAKALAKGFDFQCNVTISNETGSLLRGVGYHPGHGKVNTLSELPAVPPLCESEGNEYYFEEGVSLTNDSPRQYPPAVVMQWKLGDRDLWLLVFAYMAGPPGRNACYYEISKKEQEPSTFWDNCKKNKTWFYVGDVKHHCDTGSRSNNTPKKKAVGGVGIIGSAGEHNPMTFDVTLYEDS